MKESNTPEEQALVDVVNMESSAVQNEQISSSSSGIERKRARESDVVFHHAKRIRRQQETEDAIRKKVDLSHNGDWVREET